MKARDFLGKISAELQSAQSEFREATVSLASEVMASLDTGSVDAGQLRKLQRVQNAADLEGSFFNPQFGLVYLLKHQYSDGDAEVDLGDAQVAVTSGVKDIAKRLKAVTRGTLNPGVVDDFAEKLADQLCLCLLSEEQLIEVLFERESEAREVLMRDGVDGVNRYIDVVSKIFDLIRKSSDKGDLSSLENAFIYCFNLYERVSELSRTNVVDFRDQVNTQLEQYMRALILRIRATNEGIANKLEARLDRVLKPECGISDTEC